MREQEAKTPLLYANPVHGKKGQGKGGGADFRAPFESPNTLQSIVTAKIIDLWGEGPMGGLIDPGGPGLLDDSDPPVHVIGSSTILKSVFFDETPVMASDGSLNFNGIILRTRPGIPGQSVIPGFSDIENEVIVGLEATIELGPVTKTVSNSDVDAVRVKVRLPQLTFQDVNTGDLLENFATIAIEVNTDGAGFVELVRDTIVGKTVAPYERKYRIDLPTGSSWDVRLVRISPDEVAVVDQNRTFFSTMTEIIETRVNYNNSAIVGIEIDARQFGTRVPRRAYLVQGLEIQIPSNYDPVTRLYSPAIWDGIFKTGITDNPAWVYYDILTNSRYGAGTAFQFQSNQSRIDTDALFTIGQYCDELVEDGRGGLEPRFTYNGVINTREDAYAVLQAIASSFRGMIYYGAGAVTAAQDSPSTPRRVVNQSNVKDGLFTYSGISQSQKHSVIKSVFRDPDDFYRPTIEYVEDPGLINDFGVRTKEILSVGATSRGQARRQAKWILETERTGDLVTYRTGFHNALVSPGEIIAVADETIAGIRFGGSIKSISGGTTITFDAPITYDTTIAHTLSAILPDGTLETRTLVNVSRQNPVTLQTVTIDSAFTTDPLDGAAWGISEPSIELRQFRIVSVKEVDFNEFEITALCHDPNKFVRIDTNNDQDPLDFTNLPSGPLAVPTDPFVVEKLFKGTSTVLSKAIVSWTPPDSDPRVTLYELFVKRPGEFSFNPFGGSRDTDGITSGVTAEILDTQPGTYDFQLKSVDNFGRKSKMVTFSADLLALTLPPADVTGFRGSVSNEFVILNWDKNTELDLNHYEIRYSSVSVGATWAGAQVMAEVSGEDTSKTLLGRDGTYLIKAVDDQDDPSKNAALVVIVSSGFLAFNQVATLTENPTFSGVKVGCVVVSSKLQLNSGSVMATWIPLSSVPALSAGTGFDVLPLVATYDFSTFIDLGSRFDFRVTQNIQADGLNINNFMAAWLPLASVQNMSGFVEEELFIDLKMALTDDDPSGSPTYTPFKSLIGEDVRARAAKWQLTFGTRDKFVTPRFTVLAVTVDMADRIISGKNLTTSAVATTTVSFTPNFKSVNPAVVVTGQDMLTGEFVELTSVTASGFDIDIKDSGGSRVIRQFDFIAKGFGAVV